MLHEVFDIMPAERALDFLKEFIDPDTGDAKYANQLVSFPFHHW